MLKLIRDFFADRSVMEVTTPCLGKRGATDPHIKSVSVTQTNQTNQTYFLQSSPEFAMKRLLADGSGAIYQICPAFRGGEFGPHHNPEFTILEWYRPGFSLVELMDEVAELVAFLSAAFNRTFEPAALRSYKSLFEDRYSLNPHGATVEKLREVAASEFPDHVHHILAEDEGETDDFLDLLFSEGIEPGLKAPRFVTGFPATQASLSRIGLVGQDRVALRFELYWQGLELANGYDELRDCDELKTRISRDNRIRESRGLPGMATDERLLAAMEKMPACTGVAVGLDRLLMLLMEKSSIEEVLSFTIETC
jgi:lysyl-tRNA synthetase class 2